MLFAADGTPLGSAQREFRQHYPAPGLVEHDAAEIWNATLACTRAMIDKAGGADRVAAIGITNQRETVVRSEEHTSEIQSIMRHSYAVFCLKKKQQSNTEYIIMI